MIIVLWALLGAVLVTALLIGARLVLQRSSASDTRAVTRWAGLLFGINFAVDLFILYFYTPPLTGPYGGWQWLVWPLLLSGLICLGLSTVSAGKRMSDMLAQGRTRFGHRPVVGSEPPDWRMVMAEGIGGAGVIAIAVALLFALIFNSVISIATTWFDPNAKALASIAHVTIMPATATLPPTNVNHIVLVTQDIAAFKGQQVLAQNGQNLGSKYHLDLTEFTLQSVSQHLYWIAPLEYNNIWSNLGNYDTPGYVVVDAENPDAQSQLRTGYHLHYVPTAIFNQNLVRHVYLDGYTNGDLMDPTLEVRDDWRPFFTISLMQPSRGFTGETLHQVLIVDPQTGGIQAFGPDQVPAWVDRVIPKYTVSDYLGWWGLYHFASWFNPSGAQQQQLASQPELVYNDVDQPVWLAPMTSSSANDTSSTGIILYDTKRNDAQFYPLTGLGVGDAVKATLSSNRQNIRNYDIGSVQLYEIFGEPTWVGIFTQSTTKGATFQAVGMVDARDLTPANVIMAPSRDLALEAYSQWLATQNHVNGSGPSSTGNAAQFSGKVIRIAPVTTNGSTIYYLQIAGQKHIFTASLSLSPQLPLVQINDVVTGSYRETGQTVVTLDTFTDQSLDLGGTG